jgi:hypothetical protein
LLTVKEQRGVLSPTASSAPAARNRLVTFALM